MPAITHVQPGDLITAQYMNGLVDKLADLEQRVAALEATGGSTGVTIISVTSETTPIRRLALVPPS